MDDTANWEFAAVVAAVVIGLGGMLAFSLIAVLGSWQLFRSTGRAAEEAAKASAAMRGLAEEMMLSDGSHAGGGQRDMAVLQARADLLAEEQSHLQESILRLAERRIERNEEEERQYRDLENVMRRLEENLARVGDAAAELDRHQL